MFLVLQRPHQGPSRKLIRSLGRLFGKLGRVDVECLAVDVDEVEVVASRLECVGNAGSVVRRHEYGARGGDTQCSQKKNQRETT